MGSGRRLGGDAEPDVDEEKDNDDDDGDDFNGKDGRCEGCEGCEGWAASIGGGTFSGWGRVGIEWVLL